MAQRFKDEAGNIWEMGANGQPTLVTAAQGPSLANPKLPGELKSQTIDIAKGQGDLATQPFRIREARAQATKAEIDAKNAQDQYDAAHPKASTSGVYGDAYLKTLSQSDGSMIKALSEGRLAFPQGAALRAPFWQEKLSQVAQYDPTFDATNFNTRAQGRVNAVKGRLGQSNNALNTAIGHLGQLSDQISGTASHNFTPFNAVENSAMKMFGDAGVTNFNDTAAKLADELEAVYRNGGGAEQGVTRQLRSLDPNMSLEQKNGIVQNAMDLLASKMAANLSQYDFGTGGKPGWNMLDPHTLQVLRQKAPDLLGKYFSPPAAGDGGPSGPPPGDGPPKLGPAHDYSGMAGGPQVTAAAMDPNSKLGAFKQTYRNEFDATTAQGVSALVQHGRPYEEVAAYAQSQGFPAPDPQSYAAAVTFAKAHHGATDVEALRPVPTTLGERLSSSPGASLVGGAGNALSAGFDDELAGGLSSLTGGNYTQSRDEFNAKKHILSDIHPGYDLAGNVAGGLAVGLGGEAAMGKIAPGLVDAIQAAKYGKAAPMGGDAAYGSLYGAGENNDNRLGGAIGGAAAGVGGGMFARGATKALGRVIAPAAGAAEPLYQAGVFPTAGQRAAAMTGPASKYIGKAVNTIEQAMQSVPLLGALPAISREAARKDFQKGAFQEALSNIGQQLPPGTGPGSEAHTFTSRAFTKAYDAARSGMQFVPDGQYASDTAAFATKIHDGTLNEEQIKQVSQRIQTAVGSRMSRSPTLSGDAYKNAASELAETQRAWAKSDPLKANALGDYLSIFDGAARRSSDPTATARLDQADTGYAKFVRIQDASKRGGAAKEPGTFSPVDYAASVKQMGGGMRSNAYSRGDALGQDYAHAGLNLRDTLPNSGTADRLMIGQGLGGTGIAGIAGMGGAHVIANPVTAGMFAAYAPGVQGLVKKAIAPREYTLPEILAQPLNLMGNGIYDRSGAVGRVGAPSALSYFLSQ